MLGLIHSKLDILITSILELFRAKYKELIKSFLLFSRKTSQVFLSLKRRLGLTIGKSFSTSPTINVKITLIAYITICL
jgi:hypothetical protein